MARHLRAVLDDAALRRELIATGLRAIEARHTCRHRVDELLGIHAEIQQSRRRELGPCA
jgi:spore maturation protein CgeB